MKSYSGKYTVNKRYYEPHISCRYEDTEGRKLRCLPIIKIDVLHPCSVDDAIFFHPESLHAKVDTGAMISAFNRDASKILDIDLRSYKEVTCLTPFNDSTICVGGVHEIDIYIGGKKIEKVPVVFPLTLGDEREYVKRYKRRKLKDNYIFVRYSLSENFLGTKGFLNKVLVSLDSEHVYLFRRKDSDSNNYSVMKAVLLRILKTMRELYVRLRM